MTKTQIIERYGVEWYEIQKAKSRARNKERYVNDSEFREAYLALDSARHKGRYANDSEFRESHKAKSRDRSKERYANDSEFRESQKAKSRARNKERYVNDSEFREASKVRKLHRYCRKGEFERIENYELAKADNFKGWDVHHRLELTLDGEYAHNPEELKQMDMYYHRPYFELIFLTRPEHVKLHIKARNHLATLNLNEIKD